MTSQFRSAWPQYAELARLRPPRAYLFEKVAALILAVSAPLIVASFVTGHDRWQIFERTGSLTSAVGLLLASRRYLGHGVLELAVLQMTGESRASVVEVLEDIYTAKLGLGLSAFGMIIWGWGAYLRWWSLSYLVVWAALEARNVRRDFVRLRDTPIGVPPVEESSNSGGPGS